MQHPTISPKVHSFSGTKARRRQDGWTLSSEATRAPISDEGIAEIRAAAHRAYSKGKGRTDALPPSPAHLNGIEEQSSADEKNVPHTGKQAETSIIMKSGLKRSRHSSEEVSDDKNIPAPKRAKTVITIEDSPLLGAGGKLPDDESGTQEVCLSPSPVRRSSRRRPTPNFDLEFYDLEAEVELPEEGSTSTPKTVSSRRLRRRLSDSHQGNPFELHGSSARHSADMSTPPHHSTFSPPLQPSTPTPARSARRPPNPNFSGSSDHVDCFLEDPWAQDRKVNYF